MLFWFDRRAPDEKCNTAAGILRIHGGQKLRFYYDAIEKQSYISNYDVIDKKGPWIVDAFKHTVREAMAEDRISARSLSDF